MEKMDRILLYACERDFDAANDILMILRDTGDYFIVKKYDTITCENKGIFALNKEKSKDAIYTAREFLQNSEYVGKAGYYKEMSKLEKYISQFQTIIYKDEFNELVYDSISEQIFVSYPFYNKSEFIPFEKQQTKVRFKKGLGKKL